MSDDDKQVDLDLHEYRVTETSEREPLLARGWWKGVLAILAIFVGAIVLAYFKGWLHGVVF